jgi:Mrp family chromosome partitioning ATPase
VSHTHATLTAPAVTFVPLPAAPAGRPRETVELSGPPLSARLLDELGERVVDLAEYARSAGGGNGGTVVLLTGCRRGDGCSTVCWALARAGVGMLPVVLVDGDLAQPGLSAAVASDWVDVLEGRCALDQALRDVSGQGVTLLPLRQAVDAETVFAHPALPLWLARLRQEFGLIVLDGGPVNETGRRWAQWVDAALLVCDPAQTSARGRAEAWDALEAADRPVLGIVETFVP